jgi:hypothetical protein
MEGSVIVPVVIVVALVLVEEAVRWLLRPAGRRLRAIRKIGRQQR